jgi:hypothetical protein
MVSISAGAGKLYFVFILSFRRLHAKIVYYRCHIIFYLNCIHGIETITFTLRYFILLVMKRRIF